VGTGQTNRKPGVKASDEESTPTIQDILTAMDTAWEHVSAVVRQMGPMLNAGLDAEGWTPRQVLAHLIGSWQRVPVHAAFFLAGRGTVPIQVGDAYWIAEWETGPLEAFLLAMESAYLGGRSIIGRLDATALARRAQTPFGQTSLRELLLGSYRGHIDCFHVPQVQAFLSGASGEDCGRPQHAS
jgi:hypothetical protein